jgi:hypothetical protein
MPPILRVVCQREPHDCGVAALATYLGLSYEDALRGATLIDKHYGKGGLYLTQMMQLARGFGFTLRQRRRFSLEDDEGILRVMPVKGKLAHFVVLKAGLIFDLNGGTVWDADAYVRSEPIVTPTALLTLAGPSGEGEGT